jgi:hypothetical protein
LPVHFFHWVPRRVAPVPRPISEYGTAQQIMQVFPSPDAEASPTQFEQALPSDDEMRKAFPWQLPPAGPTPTFRLDQGVAESPPALLSGEATALPEEITGSAVGN